MFTSLFESITVALSLLDFSLLSSSYQDSQSSIPICPIQGCTTQIFALLEIDVLTPIPISTQKPVLMSLFQCISIRQSINKFGHGRPSHSSWSATNIDHHQILTFSLHPDRQDDQKVRGGAITLRILTLSKPFIS
jgi:hypothetical protein